MPLPIAESTGDKPQSKLWQHAGSWWAALPSDSPSGTWVWRIEDDGVWTAMLRLSTSTGTKADVLPVGDYGVRKGAMQLYGLKDLPKPKELESLAEPWRPYRSVASWYLWRVMDVGVPD